MVFSPFRSVPGWGGKPSFFFWLPGPRKGGKGWGIVASLLSLFAPSVSAFGAFNYRHFSSWGPMTSQSPPPRCLLTASLTLCSRLLPPFFILDDDEGITQSCRQRGAKALLDVPANVIPTLELDRVPPPPPGRGSTPIRQRRAHVHQLRTCRAQSPVKSRVCQGQRQVVGVSGAKTPWPPGFFPNESFRCSKEARGVLDFGVLEWDTCFAMVGHCEVASQGGGGHPTSHQASGEFQAFHFFFRRRPKISSLAFRELAPFVRNAVQEPPPG